jgi:hypothetical protein
VLRLADQLTRIRVMRLLEDVEQTGASEVVLDFSETPILDDALPRLAAALSVLAAKRSVKVAGLRGTNVRALLQLGIGNAEMLVGRWPRERAQNEGPGLVRQQSD